VTTERFDRLTRALITESSRRTVLGLPLIGLATAPFAAVTDAKKRKKKKKRCKGGKVRCGKRCVTTSTDKAHCGKCNNRCESQLTCVGGACKCEDAVCLVSLVETEFFPQDIAIFPNGNLLTIGYDDWLTVLSANGALVRQIGEFGIEPGEFDGPVGAVIDGQGSIYVADSGNERIQMIESNGDIEVWNFDDDPDGVAVSGSGVVYATMGYQVHRLASDGQIEYSWGPDGLPDAEFDYLQDGLVVDSGGRIYVVDNGGNKVYRFTDSGAGNIQQDWVSGSPGMDPGEFNGPNGVAVLGNLVLVPDYSNNRVQALDVSNDSFRFEWQAEDSYGLWEPEGITIAPDGRIYVTSFDSILSFELGPN
jgi:sugar lactone lactonase YvrE